MKMIVTPLFSAFIIFTSFTASKADGKPSNVSAVNNTLAQYVATVTQGRADHLDQLFSDSFTQRINGSGKANTFNKSQTIGLLKANKNIQQQCTTTFSIVDENNGCSIAKVEMKYPSFTKVDYVTITKDEKGYQVSQVVTTFK
ncbi:Putative lumazine-binding [bacterium A37T11]|nr:Putative lumazine-binding [bacterium A37T11]